MDNKKPLYERIREIMEEADIDDEPVREEKKSPLGKVLAVGLVLIFIAVGFAGCVSTSSISDEAYFTDDDVYYYIPALDKYVSHDDPDFADLYNQYGETMEVRYTTFTPYKNYQLYDGS